MPSVLRKEISTVWLIPLSLIGLPFLLAAGGRLFRALGAENSGDTLVEWARVYGNLPIFLLGFSPSVLEDTILAYIVAGIVYAGVVFLIVVAGGWLRRRVENRSRG